MEVLVALLALWVNWQLWRSCNESKRGNKFLDGLHQSFLKTFLVYSVAIPGLFLVAILLMRFSPFATSAITGLLMIHNGLFAGIFAGIQAIENNSPER